jgi:hypothetical protein
MITIAAIILMTLFGFLSGLHLFWVLGGKWASDGVFPTKDDHSKFPMPGIIPTLIVAFGLLLFAFITSMKIWHFRLPFCHDIISKYGLWVIASIFVVRAIGEFNYIGLFKKVKNTTFGIKDTKIYTPLCIVIGILALILAKSN